MLSAVVITKGACVCPLRVENVLACGSIEQGQTLPRVFINHQISLVALLRFILHLCCMFFFINAPFVISSSRDRPGTVHAKHHSAIDIQNGLGDTVTGDSSGL